MNPGPTQFNSASESPQSSGFSRRVQLNSLTMTFSQTQSSAREGCRVFEKGKWANVRGLPKMDGPHRLAVRSWVLILMYTLITLRALSTTDSVSLQL